MYTKKIGEIQIQELNSVTAGHRARIQIYFHRDNDNVRSFSTADMTFDSCTYKNKRVDFSNLAENGGNWICFCEPSDIVEIIEHGDVTFFKFTSHKAEVFINLV